jgi:hypothetical protein
MIQHTKRALREARSIALDARISVLQQEKAELVKALKPFADYTYWSGDFEKAQELVRKYGDECSVGDTGWPPTI